ncbi:hypothetical protein GCM10009809_33280 [Isoptericola hypogeus]|uniref:Sortase family protein n=1 Tax=Isoptericola hypogeus TaxID=300179 RepID=A0ABP4VU52_9MICO
MTPLPRTIVARAACKGAVRAAVVAAALALAGCAADDAAPTSRAGDGPAHGVGAAPQRTPGATEGRRAATPAADVPVRPAKDSPDPAPPAPVRVEVPALGITVPVRATGVDDRGAMALPGSADVAGWYRFGAAPASPAGTTVVAAHVDDEDSVGPFARLNGAETGTVVRVRTEDGTTHNYTVTNLRATAKHELSPDAVFDRSGPSRLVLVTCGGEWDAEARSYAQNVVVTAVPAR